MAPARGRTARAIPASAWRWRRSRGGSSLRSRGSFALPQERVHVGEEILRLGLLHFLRSGFLRAGEIDDVAERLGNVLEKPRGGARQRLPAPDPLGGAGHDQPLARAGHADVAEPPLLLEIER